VSEELKFHKTFRCSICQYRFEWTGILVEIEEEVIRECDECGSATPNERALIKQVAHLAVEVQEIKAFLNL